MSRKNKTLRAFLHQTQDPTIKQAWDAAWKHAQKKFHAKSMQAMEKQLATAQAENESLRERVAELEEALRSLVNGYVNLLEAGRDRITSLGGDCDPVPVMEQNDPWLRDARVTLSWYNLEPKP